MFGPPFYFNFLLNKLIFIFYWRTECVRCAISNGAGGIGALILLAQGGSMRQYIGAPMSSSANRQS
jgi:hypothetical protein